MKAWLQYATKCYCWIFIAMPLSCRHHCKSSWSWFRSVKKFPNIGFPFRSTKFFHSAHGLENNLFRKASFEDIFAWVCMSLNQQNDGDIGLRHFPSGRRHTNQFYSFIIKFGIGWLVSAKPHRITNLWWVLFPFPFGHHIKYKRNVCGLSYHVVARKVGFFLSGSRIWRRETFFSNATQRWNWGKSSWRLLTHLADHWKNTWQIALKSWWSHTFRS